MTLTAIINAKHDYYLVLMLNINVMAVLWSYFVFQSVHLSRKDYNRIKTYCSHFKTGLLVCNS